MLDAHAAALSAPPEGQFRSSGASNGNGLDRCRESLGRVLGISAVDRIFFASGATDATNALIHSLPLAGKRVLDASQSAGCLPVDADVRGVDVLIFTGHKALFGPQGTGGYYVRPGVPLRPLLYLYLRLHRPSQGRHDRASKPGQLCTQE